MSDQSRADIAVWLTVKAGNALVILGAVPFLGAILAYGFSSAAWLVLAGLLAPVLAGSYLLQVKPPTVWTGDSDH